MRIPEDGKIFSVNEGNFQAFPEGVQQYVNWCKEKDAETKRPYGARYIGSLIADIHRNLIKGGIYLYPPTAKDPNGKLRLMYECNTMAFIVEQAGGVASNRSRARDGCIAAGIAPTRSIVHRFAKHGEPGR
jgi:fructose-1,6-bisphosphatase I